jgi:hypothetical protein
MNPTKIEGTEGVYAPTQYNLGPNGPDEPLGQERTIRKR